MRSSWRVLAFLASWRLGIHQFGYGLDQRDVRVGRQLVADGIPPDEARELADLYPFKMSDIIEAAREVN